MQKYTSVPLTASNWRNISIFTGRLATMEDVKSYKAIFCSIKAESQICKMDLPFCAIFNDKKTGKQFPIVVVQAEMAHKEVVLGAVKMDGSTTVCTLSEVEIVNEPDKIFFKRNEDKPWWKFWHR